MGKLSGKNALVTGGHQGSAGQSSERLAADGANLAVHYGTNEAAAEQTVEAIKAHGGTAFSVRAARRPRRGGRRSMPSLPASLVAPSMSWSTTWAWAARPLE